MHTVRARFIDGQVMLDPDQNIPENNCRVLVVFLEPDCGADGLPVERPCDDPESRALLRQFTPREMDILRCLRRGLSNKQIAQELNIRGGTVRNYTSRIYAKLKVTSRTEAAIRAAELGVQPD